MMKRCSSFCELQRALEQNTHTQKKKKKPNAKAREEKKMPQKVRRVDRKGRTTGNGKKAVFERWRMREKTLACVQKKKVTVGEQEKRGKRETCDLCGWKYSFSSCLL